MVNILRHKTLVLKVLPKQKVTATIDGHLLESVDQEIEKYRFRNRSHALEYALAKLIENEEGGIKSDTRRKNSH